MSNFWRLILIAALLFPGTAFLTQVQDPNHGQITRQTGGNNPIGEHKDVEAPEDVSLSLNKTVGTDTLACATMNSISVAPGTKVTYCYTVTNTGSESLTTHTLVDDQLGPILTNFLFTLVPSASAFITATAVINTPVTNIATWTAESSGGGTAFDSDFAIVSLLEPKLSLSKTVGLDPNSCSTEDSITVDPGTRVTYCYTVTNTGELDLVSHTLVDDLLGSILTDFPYSLAPMASAFITSTAIINTPVTNLATWTGYTSGHTPTFDTDTATVNLTFFGLYLPFMHKP